MTTTIEETEEDKRCRFFNTAEEIGMSIEEAKKFYEVANRVKQRYGKEFIVKLTNDNFSKGIMDAYDYIEGFEFVMNQWKPIQIGVIKLK